MLSQKRLINLLQKYDVPGPRYTSYPTVPAWTEDVAATDYEKSLGLLNSDKKLSFYFHLPFCEKLCHFCGCMQVITKDHTKSAAYTKTLCSEIDRVASCIPQKARDVAQIQFGGGTPNFFKPEEISQIMNAVRHHFNVLPEAEISIEMHPKTSTEPFCDNLKKEGFNRISLGVQDFDERVQRLINRNQTYQVTRGMIDYLRMLGFDAFNIDLVYGLPGQSEKGWSHTLKLITDEVKPNRLAVYSYAHVPWVRPVQRTFKDEDIPSPEQKLAFFAMAYNHLTQNGYRLIGMDHFALEDDALSKALDDGSIHRNFMGYTTISEAHQIGFGMSGISYAHGNYFQNKKKIKDYDTDIQAGKLPIFRGYLLGEDDCIRRALITSIMCQGRVDVVDFEKKWGVVFNEYFGEALPHLQGFVDDNLLKISDKEIQVVGEGFLFLRNIAMCFDPYLEGIRQKSKSPTFSRTV
jgi:oxygen-independent coproporphyrinogen-3 oxidase